LPRGARGIQVHCRSDEQRQKFQVRSWSEGGNHAWREDEEQGSAGWKWQYDQRICNERIKQTLLQYYKAFCTRKSWMGPFYCLWQLPAHHPVQGCNGSGSATFLNWSHA